MPKINVYPPYPNPDGSNADRRVEVGWHPNGSVQVGTAVRNKVKVDSMPGVTVTVPPGGTVDADGWIWEGQYIDLDRQGINNLIRALREARDKAFGRDE